jgi:hypothetical protein
METKEQISKETFNKNVECMECDLASLESIKKFTDSINKSKNQSIRLIIMFKKI